MASDGQTPTHLPHSVHFFSSTVAISSAGVAILRHHRTTQEVTRGKIFEQEQISRAATLGVGIVSAHQIDLVSLDEPSEIAAHMVKNILIK